MTLYVVTAPSHCRGIYAMWPECQAVVHGVSGAQFQAGSSQALAEAALSGEGVHLSPGLYAFVDGNHLGGVGVVLVHQVPNGTPDVEEISVSVQEVFRGTAFLVSAEAVASALARLRNVLAEVAGLCLVLRRVAALTAVTVVYDYEGVGAWLTGRWKTKDPTVRDIVLACHHLIASKQLTVRVPPQTGHQSTVAGRKSSCQEVCKWDQAATLRVFSPETRRPST